MARRPTAWADTNVQQALVDGVKVDLDLLSDLAAEDTKMAVRLIVKLALYSDNISSAVESAMRLDIGAQVVTQEAFTAGGAALPSPSISSQQPALGWYWKDRVLYIQGLDGAGVLNWHRVPEIQVDIRAARKVDRGILSLSMVANDDIGTPINTRVVGVVRVLCMT